MSDTTKYRLETLALHAGQEIDPTTQSRAVPIYQTTSYVFKDSDHAANLFALKEFGNIYTRLMNPTTDVLEKRIAALEGGVAGVAFSSGMAAITAAIFNICPAGYHIVSSNSLYGGTCTLFTHTLPQMGIQVSTVDPNNPDNFRKAIQPNTRAIYIETIGNPKNDVLDYKAIVKIAHDNGLPVGRPLSCRPLHGRQREWRSRLKAEMTFSSQLPGLPDSSMPMRLLFVTLAPSLTTAR